MNTVNNRRRRETVRKIEAVFMEFLNEQELSQIRVTDICEKAKINRGTFYANFLDVYDLAEKLHKRLAGEVILLFAPETELSYSFLRLFEHIKENQSLNTNPSHRK